MASQFIVPAFGFPSYLNQTNNKSEILSGVYVNEATLIYSNSIGSVSGTADGSVFSATLANSVGSSSGIADGQAITSSIVSSVGSISSNSTVQAFASSLVFSIGSSTGNSTVQAITSSIVSSVGSISSNSTVQAIASSFSISVGTVSSNGSAQAETVINSSAIGNAFGLASSSFIGEAHTNTIGLTIGNSIVSGVSSIEVYSTGNSTGNSTAASVSETYHLSTGISNGYSVGNSVGSSQSRSSSATNGIGHALAISTEHVLSVGTSNATATVIGAGGSLLHSIGNAVGIGFVDGMSSSINSGTVEISLPPVEVASDGFVVVGGQGSISLSSPSIVATGYTEIYIVGVGENTLGNLNVSSIGGSAFAIGPTPIELYYIKYNVNGFYAVGAGSVGAFNLKVLTGEVYTLSMYQQNKMRNYGRNVQSLFTQDKSIQAWLSSGLNGPEFTKWSISSRALTTVVIYDGNSGFVTKPGQISIPVVPGSYWFNVKNLVNEFNGFYLTILKNVVVY